MSIRTAFNSDRASGLALWTSCLHFFELLNYPWFGILEYIIAYYKLNQNAMPDTWFDPNTILISQYLTLHQQRPLLHQSLVGSSKSGGGSKSSGLSRLPPLQKPPARYVSCLIARHAVYGLKGMMAKHALTVMSATGVPQINTTLRNVPNGRRLDLTVPSPPTTAFITPYRF